MRLPKIVVVLKIRLSLEIDDTGDRNPIIVIKQ